MMALLRVGDWRVLCWRPGALTLSGGCWYELLAGSDVRHGVFRGDSAGSNHDGAALMKSFGRVLCVLALLFGVNLVHAEEINATVTGTLAVKQWGDGAGVWSNTYSAGVASEYARLGCTSWVSGSPYAEPSTGSSPSGFGIILGACMRSGGMANPTLSYRYFCASGALTWNGTAFYCGAVGYTCPPNEGWTLNGAYCQRTACTATQRRYNGVCKEACKSEGSYDANGGQILKGFSYGEGAGKTCIGGCEYYVTERSEMLGPAPANPVDALRIGQPLLKIGASAGTSCSPDKVGVGETGSTLPPGETKPAPSGADVDVAKCGAKGQGWGLVNGLVVCSGTAPDSVTTAKKTTTVSDSDATSDGPVVRKIESSTSKCEGDKCTTTTTTKNETVGTGGTVTGSTTASETKSESRADFCAKNPKDASCLQSSGQDDYCKGHPEKAGCADMGTPVEPSQPVGTRAVGLSTITPVALAGSQSCPADVTLFGNAAFGWAPVCSVVDWLRPLVLALAWLSAGFVVMGGLRNG